MNAKELQEEYLKNLVPKTELVKQKKELPAGYISHVRKQAETLSRMLDRENGIHYIQEALREWSDEELKSLGD